MGDKKISSKKKEVSNFKLNTLLEVTIAINDNLSIGELLKRYEKLLKEDLNIGRILIFKLNEKWECILNTGFSESLCIDDLEEYLLPKKE